MVWEIDALIQQSIESLYISKDLALAFSGILIGLIIPVAFFLVENIDTKDFELDRSVILKKVINLKILAGSIIMLTVPIFIYSTKLPVKIFMVSLYMIGVYMFCQQIIAAIKWMDIKQTGKLDKNNSYRNAKRYEYLKSLKDYEEKLNVWGYLFENGIENTGLDELKTMKIFLEIAAMEYHQKPNKSGLLVIFHQLYLVNRRFAEYKRIDLLDSYVDRIFENILVETIRNMDLKKAKIKSDSFTIYPQGYEPSKDPLSQVDWSRIWRDIEHIKQQDSAWAKFDEEQQLDPYWVIFVFLLKESQKRIELHRVFSDVVGNNHDCETLINIVDGINNADKRQGFQSSLEAGRIIAKEKSNTNK